MDAGTALATVGKNEWVAEARRAFIPGARLACMVCGKFKALTQAHHITPLAAQYENGFTTPCHKYVWLCPTHHAAVHLVLSQYLAKRVESTENLIEMLSELNGDGHGRAVLNFATIGICNLRTAGDLRIARERSP